MELARKEIQVVGEPELPATANWKPVSGEGARKLPTYNSRGEIADFRVQVDMVLLRARTRQILSWAPLISHEVGSNPADAGSSMVQGARNKPSPFVETYVVALSTKGSFTHYKGQEAVAIFSEPGLHKLWFCFGKGGQKYFATMDVNVLPRPDQISP